MNPYQTYRETKISHQVAPLIDVVFLLLIYFMVTASVIKKEGDIAFRWPVLNQAPVIDLPVEAYIQISADGSVLIEGMSFDRSDRNLPGLSVQVAVLRQMAEAQHSPFFVTLAPDDKTLHRRIIDVMDACAEADVKNLSFARNNA